MSLSKKIDQRYIKNENRKWLVIYFLIQIVIFALFTGNTTFNINDADQFIARIKNPQGFISLSVAILIIVMEAPMATLKSPTCGRVKIPQRQICKI
jgi:hypothetical protein